MSRRRNRARGFTAGFGAAAGFAAFWCCLVVLPLAGLFLFFRLWGLTGDPVAALLVMVLLVAGAVSLWRWRHDMAVLVRAWLAGRGVLLDVPDGEIGGHTYSFVDAYGRERYDGSAGDLESLIARLREHYDPQGRSALSGKVGPGWSVTVRMVDSRDEAFRLEGLRIAKRIGRPGYENRRLEGRGSR